MLEIPPMYYFQFSALNFSLKKFGGVEYFNSKRIYSDFHPVFSKQNGFAFAFFGQSNYKTPAHLPALGKVVAKLLYICPSWAKFLQNCNTFAHLEQSCCKTALHLPALGKAVAKLLYICPPWAKFLQNCNTFAHLEQSCCETALRLPALGKAAAKLPHICPSWAKTL